MSVYFNQQNSLFEIIKVSSIARFSTTSTYLYSDPVFENFVVSLSHTVTSQSKDLSLLYSYSEINIGNLGYSVSGGVGINLLGVIGFEFGHTIKDNSSYDINASVSVGNIVLGGSLGSSGIGISIGFTNNNITNTFTVNFEWKTVALVAATVVTVAAIVALAVSASVGFSGIAASFAGLASFCPLGTLATAVTAIIFFLN